MTKSRLSPPPLIRGISTYSAMSSDDSDLLDVTESRSLSPIKNTPSYRNLTAATPTVDNRRRTIFPAKNSYRSASNGSRSHSPYSSPSKNQSSSGNNSLHVPQDKSPNDRKTRIQVCVRVRPILPSDNKINETGGGRGNRIFAKAGTHRHVQLKHTPPRKKERRNSRSMSPSMKGKESNDTEPAWDVHNNTNVTQSPHTNPDTSRTVDYTFDHSFGPRDSTKDIYENSVRDSVVSTMEGYHASVFAYGQTATGKTYTMTGSNGMKNYDPNNDSAKGIIQFAIQDCFNYIYNQKSETREYLLRVSFMEIYNEVINDLLATPTKAPQYMSTSMNSPSTPPVAPSNIRIFESKNEGVIVRGLKEEIVTCPEQVYALLAAGERRRQTGTTSMNKQSSRSHSIFRLIIESRKRIPRQISQKIIQSDSSSVAESIASSTFAPESTAGPVRVSTLSLVDLAGSESVKNTGSTGSRQKEGQYINKSLLTLGHVVYKLAEISSKEGRTLDSIHIPYRDSKLTRLLQPSLSGNAQICIICNISPLSKHIEESHLTLKFATRAKKIKQNATITEAVDEKTLLDNYREEIEELKRQLKEARDGFGENSEQQNPAMKEVNEEDAFVLSEAISNLERLILKTSTAEERKRRKKRRERMAAQKNGDGIFDIPSGLMEKSYDQADDALLTMLDEKSDDDGDEDLLASLSLNSKDKTPQDNFFSEKYFSEKDTNSVDIESMSMGDESTIVEGQKLISELNRIRGLLGNVLERKGNTGSTNNGDGTPVKLNLSAAKNDQEVERLRAQLHEQAVTTSLRKADTSFLQSQLQEKDKLLNDVSQILGAVEKRQVELEAENEKIKLEYTKSITLLKSKESEVMILEKLMKKREIEIKKLKQKLREPQGELETL